MRRVRTAALWLAAAAALAALGAWLFWPAHETNVRVGSKKFTESVILGDIGVGLIRSAGAPAEHVRELGGTRLLWDALLAKDIDAYPEYTGTLSQEIMAGAVPDDESSLRAALARYGVSMTRTLGFSDSYAIGMPRALAQRLGIERISDLVRHPELRFGFSNEFMDRGDGWPALRSRYHLPQRQVQGLDHDLAYRGLAGGTLDATDLYTTDAEIKYYDLVVLQDDLHYFPRYDAVFLYRSELERSVPAATSALRALEGKIDERSMVDMNAQAKLQRRDEAAVAGEFLQTQLALRVETVQESTWDRLVRRTQEHLFLVGVSLGFAVAVSVPLGIVAQRRPRLGQSILAVVGTIQTLPSLALLVFMIPLLGIGARPAIVALFFYSLLPIVRNTYTGLREIPLPMRESAEALGLPRRAQLWRIELPMASRSILAGIKTSTVINVGTATLGALIGAGGFGQPILTGIRLDNVSLILQGAIPAAVLALAAQGIFELADRLIVPRGLRLKAQT